MGGLSPSRNVESCAGSLVKEREAQGFKVATDEYSSIVQGYSRTAQEGMRYTASGVLADKARPRSLSNGLARLTTSEKASLGEAA